MSNHKQTKKELVPNYSAEKEFRVASKGFYLNPSATNYLILQKAMIRYQEEAIR